MPSVTELYALDRLNKILNSLRNPIGIHDFLQKEIYLVPWEI